MDTNKMTTEELTKRRVEFLIKLKELMTEYVARINYTPFGDDPCRYSIVTDGHLKESWGNETLMRDIEDDEIDECINQLTII